MHVKWFLNCASRICLWVQTYKRHGFLFVSAETLQDRLSQSVCGELISSRDVTTVCRILWLSSPEPGIVIEGRGNERDMNLFHKVYTLWIPFSTCLYTINTVRNGCAVAAYGTSLCPRVMTLEISVILSTWSDSFVWPRACSVPLNWSEFTLFSSWLMEKKEDQIY